MIQQDSDSNGGDEQNTEQATLGDTIPEFDGVHEPREFDWQAGLQAGVKALVILSIAGWGLFYLMQTGTLHISIATGVGTTLLLEMTNITEFLGEF